MFVKPAHIHAHGAPLFPVFHEARTDGTQQAIHLKCKREQRRLHVT